MSARLAEERDADRPPPRRAADGGAITAEAALNVLGIGVPPPDPNWGTMIGGSLSVQVNPPWWLVIFPGLAITATVFSVNLAGDARRDLLDPNPHGRIERG